MHLVVAVGLRCQTIARCSFHPEDQPYSDTTASGVRVLTLIADEFEAETRRQQLTQEIIGHALTLFVGPGVAGARAKASTVATVSRLVGVRPAITALRPAGKRGATGAIKALAKPVYRPFTRANFRHNLAQRTGGIPDNTQAQRVGRLLQRREPGQRGNPAIRPQDRRKVWTHDRILRDSRAIRIST